MTSRRSGRPAQQQPGGDALAALRLVTETLADRKAIDPLVLDLRGLTGAADYFVIVSGTSDAHVRGMAEHLMTTLAPRGIAPHHVEGLGQGRWVLLDYVDFVVHVFHPELRDFYQLERLWSDAPVLGATLGSLAPGGHGGRGGRGGRSKG
jgi:ribosome-associated protein